MKYSVTIRFIIPVMLLAVSPTHSLTRRPGRLFTADCGDTSHGRVVVVRFSAIGLTVKLVDGAGPHK